MSFEFSCSILKSNKRITTTKCNPLSEKCVSSLLQQLFCQQPVFELDQQKENKRERRNKAPGIIITVIDNSNSINNKNKGHPGISSHICFSICCVKHTVIRLPFHFHLECQGCRQAVDGKVSSAHFLHSQLHSQPN